MGCAASKSSESSALEKRFHGKRRLSQKHVSLGYFYDTDKVKWMLSNYPLLMLFPWEYQRAMGLVKAANPMALEYTFLSHQWETPGHPFPDLIQISEHVDKILTPWF